MYTYDEHLSYLQVGMRLGENLGFFRVEPSILYLLTRFWNIPESLRIPWKSDKVT